MRFDELLHKLYASGGEEALVCRGQSYTFNDLELSRLEWIDRLESNGVRAGQIIGLRADYSYDSICLLLALFSNRNVVVFVPGFPTDEEALLSDVPLEGLFDFHKDGTWTWQKREGHANHPLLLSLRESNSAGFVIFSSGSSGKPKAILHNLERFLIKFESAKKQYRTLAFLLFDHIAGIDTLFYTLSSCGCLVLPERRDVSYICKLIERHGVEVLPTSPTFLNLLCLSGEHDEYDLSSLKIITYGSEPMSQTVLNRVHELLGGCRLIQKYGASEFGSPRSVSRANNELWMKIKKDDCEVKIVNNILWVKSESAMMGYLNAPNPFDKDGWFCTGDEVRVTGDWMHIRGRKSDIILVGGEKVYPPEIESVIAELDEVLDVSVRGEPYPLTGQIVCAKVQVREPEKKDQITKIVRSYCRQKLARHKIPVKIEVTGNCLTSSRQKKIRSHSFN